MIKTLFFFENGNVAATNRQGQQIPEEQRPAWEVVLRDKLARGVIDSTTVVARQGYPDELAFEILRRLPEMDHETEMLQHYANNPHFVAFVRGIVAEVIELERRSNRVPFMEAYQK